jgi:hypothetical protein
VAASTAPAHATRSASPPAAATAHPPDPLVSPGGAATHVPVALHTLGAAHSPSEAHDVPHVPAAVQMNGEQSCLVSPSPLTDVFPSQVAPVMHAPALHSVPFVQSALVVQLVLHALPAHVRFFGHTLGVPSTHAPRPSHVLSVSEFPTHVEPHATLTCGYAHSVASWPSQAPPQVAPAPAHAGLVPCGAPPRGTVAHCPTLPARSHAWHCPRQSLAQQTPSTQKSEAQSASVAHG